LSLLLLFWLPLAVCGQHRIASLNLCTDLLLLEMVRPERIVSLTYWAADPDLSYLADRAQGFHLNQSLAEQIVPRQPDLVLAGQFSDMQVVSLLRKLGYRVEVLQVPLNLEGMREHILAFGDLVGEAERAAALTSRVEQRLARVQSQVRRDRRLRHQPLAVVYGPQGVSPGRGTLMDDLLGIAGYRNLAAEKGIASYGSVSLEHLVMAEPDLLVLDDLSYDTNSIAHHALRHPVLAQLFSPERVMQLPPALTACIGPAAADVAETLLARRLILLEEGER
jgi:iron complex transport system substrate-binding protein